MREIPEDVLYDKRLVDRHIAQGLITAADVEKRIKDVEDAVEFSAVIDLDEITRAAEKKNVVEGVEP